MTWLVLNLESVERRVTDKSDLEGKLEESERSAHLTLMKRGEWV
jgi:hypothetical protein